jgi:hypothetical protein
MPPKKKPEKGLIGKLEDTTLEAMGLVKPSTEEKLARNASVQSRTFAALGLQKGSLPSGDRALSEPSPPKSQAAEQFHSTLDAKRTENGSGSFPAWYASYLRHRQAQLEKKRDRLQKPLLRTLSRRTGRLEEPVVPSAQTTEKLQRIEKALARIENRLQATSESGVPALGQLYWQATRRDRGAGRDTLSAQDVRNLREARELLHRAKTRLNVPQIESEALRQLQFWLATVQRPGSSPTALARELEVRQSALQSDWSSTHREIDAKLEAFFRKRLGAEALERELEPLQAKKVLVSAQLAGLLKKRSEVEKSATEAHATRKEWQRLSANLRANIAQEKKIDRLRGTGEPHPPRKEPAGHRLDGVQASARFADRTDHDPPGRTAYPDRLRQRA